MDASYIPIVEAGGFTTHWIKYYIPKRHKKIAEPQ